MNLLDPALAKSTGGIFVLLSTGTAVPISKIRALEIYNSFVHQSEASERRWFPTR